MSNNKIALTASMRSNLLSLQNTQKLMNKTQDHLSSGYKVNSAMDNPSSYFTAQALNSRANDLSTLLDSIGQAISTLEVADQGITSLQDFVEQAKAVANSARDTANVQANVSSKVKFDTDALRSKKVADQVSGLRPGSSDMTIRLGDATKLEGTTNVNEQTALSQLGIATSADAHDIGTISVGEKSYTIDASGTTKQMTTVQSYGEKSVLKITDATDLTKAEVEDAAGNKYVLDLSAVADVAATANADVAKQITVDAGKEGAIKATVSEDGKTTWELSDASAWKAVGEHTVTDTYASSTIFAYSNAEATGTAHHFKVTLTDAAGNSYDNVEVDCSSGTDLSGTSGFFTGGASFVKIDGELQAQTAAFAGTEAGAAANGAATTTDVVTGRPLKDLAGEARDIKGTFTYALKATETATFKVSDVDADNKTATLTDKDGNVFKNVNIDGADDSAVTAIGDATEITFTAAADMTFSFSMAQNGKMVAMSATNASTGAGINLMTLAAVDDTGADADAQGTMTEANTIYIDNGGSVQDMAETMQTMIGNTTIKKLRKKKEREKVVKNHDGALIHLPRQTPFPFEERG